MPAPLRYWFNLFLLLFASTVLAELVIPKLASRVTDLTGTLTQMQVSSLEQKLAAFEAQKGSQIAVLVVSSTQPLDIAEYGIQVADLWRVGRKGVDDGLILIVAKDDRKMRLEVGYGLEGVIPDAIAKRVISETITPYFKAGDFAGGINAGLEQVIKLIEGEPLPPPKPTGTNGVEASGEGGHLFVLIAGLFAGSVLTTLFGRMTAGLVAGVGSAAIASMLFGLGIGAIIIGVLVFFLTSVSGGGGGWSSGGGYGGGFGRGGYSGGSSGWSGGGGGFGGGGASGSW